MSYPEIRIGRLLAGLGHPPLVVAEIGINHGGNLKVALELAASAVKAGAKVVKHQTHIPDAEMSSEARSVIPGNADKSIYEVISENSISLEDEVVLAEYVRSLGAVYISTPFSKEAAVFLNEVVKVEAFKIGSGECNNYPLIELIADFGKPIILSTGMNSLDSIRLAVDVFRRKKTSFALLHCTNLYPTPDKLIRLNAIQEIQREFPDAVTGLSDHSLSNYPCLGAVALGASILERHFTDSKDRIGPDIVCSMTPSELSELIEGSAVIHSTLGHGKSAVIEEAVTIAFAFSSVVSTRDILEGEFLTLENVWVKRPSGGDFKPIDLEKVLGRKARSYIPADTQIRKTQLGD